MTVGQCELSGGGQAGVTLIVLSKEFNEQQFGLTPSSSSSSSSISTQGSSNFSSPSSNVSSFSWRSIGDCRASSRLSMTENPNSVPMRMYAGCLRPDIQYKTVGVTPTTTCEEVVTALLTKCKVRYKDPRLFMLTMEVDIRGPVGSDTRASIELEDTATPLQLQECYPKGQARFCLQMKRGTLVKVFDGSNTVGWQYKSIMISEKTTTGELIDILFRYAPKNFDDLNFYSLHIEVNDWKRQLEWDAVVVEALNSSSRWGNARLVLRCHQSPPSSLVMASSTCSLYDNVNQSVTDHPGDTESPPSGRSYWRRRTKSLSDASSRFSLSTPSSHSIMDPSITNFAKLKSRYDNYELSEAFFV
ncbi:unnamed protein product [Allacma fusca]|uniref:Ras-associating domain-containing protein n=1 Tax=Allacma fusca TaxID=39272 RepID=A0A8J2KJF1_9HEXA|nr:unnamed protein product [Allacma fusca]